MRFLDTNVLLRYYTAGDADKAEAARRLLTEIERGEQKVVTTPMVIFETVFTLQRSYGVAREQIKAMVGDIITLPGIQLAEKKLCLEALELFVEHRISYADAYTVAHMQARGITAIYSWDSEFDKVEGIDRIEPA
jgi:predicted nucleic acid-binding protein